MTEAQGNARGHSAFERDTLDVLPDVLRFAKSLALDADVAADLVQETYLRAYRSRTTFDSTKGARQWLFAICRNVFLRARERDRWLVSVADDAELEALASAQLHNEAMRDGLGDAFCAPDFGPALERAMAALSEHHRIAFALVDIGEYSYAEAAEHLGIPIGTVRSRLSRARRELQAHLIEHARDAGIARGQEDAK